MAAIDELMDAFAAMEASWTHERVSSLRDWAIESGNRQHAAAAAAALQEHIDGVHKLEGSTILAIAFVLNNGVFMESDDTADDGSIDAHELGELQGDSVKTNTSCNNSLHELDAAMDALSREVEALSATKKPANPE